jgi:hypothetical protein
VTGPAASDSPAPPLSALSEAVGRGRRRPSLAQNFAELRPRVIPFPQPRRVVGGYHLFFGEYHIRRAKVYNLPTIQFTRYTHTEHRNRFFSTFILFYFSGTLTVLGTCKDTSIDRSNLYFGQFPFSPSYYRNLIPVAHQHITGPWEKKEINQSLQYTTLIHVLSRRGPRQDGNAGISLPEAAKALRPLPRAQTQVSDGWRSAALSALCPGEHAVYICRQATA